MLGYLGSEKNSGLKKVRYKVDAGTVSTHEQINSREFTKYI
jgi:hypothetical protein